MSTRQGCQTCARRRIVCDGATPTCQKCAKRGLECRRPNPAYRVRFKNEQDQGAHLTAKGSSKTLNSTPSRPQQPARPVITTPVDLSAIECARSLFLSSSPAIFSGSGAADPILRFIAPALNGSPQNSLIVEATDAVALTALAVSQNRSEIQQLAHQKQSKLIRTLRERLAQLSAAPDHAADLLMTVFLLCLYEYIASQEPSSTAFVQHLMGIATLANHCNLKDFPETETGRLFLHSLRLQTLCMSLFLSFPMPPFNHPDGWCAGLDNSEVGNLHRRLLDLVDLRTRSAFAHSLPDAEQRLLLVKKTLHEAKQLYCSLVKTPLESSSTILPTQVVDARYELSTKDMDQIESFDFWPGNIFLYTDLLSCSHHIVFLIGRMMCLAVIVRCLNTIATSKTHHDTVIAHERESAAYYMLQLRTVVDELCANIPYNLGVRSPGLPKSLKHLTVLPLDARGALYLWNPLLFALCLEGVPDLQRRWLLGRLKFLGDKLGVKIAKVWLQMAQPHLVFAGEANLNDMFGVLAGWDNLKLGAMRGQDLGSDYTSSRGPSPSTTATGSPSAGSDGVGTSPGVASSEGAYGRSMYGSTPDTAATDTPDRAGSTDTGGFDTTQPGPSPASLKPKTSSMEMRWNLNAHLH